MPGGQNFQVDANWKLWHENGMDPFHVHRVHQTYFDYAGDATKIGKERAKSQGVSVEEFELKASAETMMSGPLQGADEDQDQIRVRSRQRSHGL